ncbi:ribonuclease P protein component [Antarcticimicrobium luteum]|uniref:Ribonuclease P protein component n=1 Tax=Antarcticimicrobium luteum TaxID=2547397 RepID=A0A4R5UX37_9RHOB|nr:ribonuclease P protein component [Antarcticimicrobium luteum]TDK43880.1 ribonuclease P protein component [Antarcticimicrobium luteum]
MPLQTMRKRAEFLAASRARRQATATMVVQARRRPEGHAATGIRVGYTCSKKVGNAVARNRAKRRLREVARAILPDLGHDGWDYVLIGRRDTTVAAPYESLLGDLRYAMAKLHADRNKSRP